MASIRIRTSDMKYFYTDLINELVQNPAEKLKVFDKNSPYLPTRKIGKNNPKAEEIRIDNYLRQEWNNMVDRAIVEGVTEEELRLTKKMLIGTIRLFFTQKRMVLENRKTK
ncbi:hypothetical protein [uncultured Merdimonas sp.]|uniref:hypothetical protein n=1 Tax=uncultured Merdimonas sp. TaxID=2023269 RepID=UPI003207AAF8